MRVTGGVLGTVHHRGLPVQRQPSVLGVGGPRRDADGVPDRVGFVLADVRLDPGGVVTRGDGDLRTVHGSRGVGDRERGGGGVDPLGVGVPRPHPGGGLPVPELPPVGQQVAVVVGGAGGVEGHRAALRVGVDVGVRARGPVATHVREPLERPGADVGVDDVAVRRGAEADRPADVGAQRRALRCAGQPALVVVAQRPQFAVGVVAEEVRAPVPLRIARAGVDHTAGDAVGVVRALPVPQAHQRPGVVRVRAAGELPVAGGAGGALPARPAVGPARTHEVDLLPGVPADVAHERQAGARVQGEAERTAETPREDLAAGGVGGGRVVERVVRDAPAVRVEMQDLALHHRRVLGPQGLRVHLGVVGHVAHRDPQRAVGVRHDAGDPVHDRVTGDAEQFGLVGQPGRLVRAGDAPTRQGEVEGPVPGGHRPGQIDVPGGPVVDGRGEPEQPHVLDADDGQVAQRAAAGTVGRHPGDGALLAAGEHATVRQVGEVGELARSLSGGQAPQGEPGRQFGGRRPGRRSAGGPGPGVRIRTGVRGGDDGQTRRHQSGDGDGEETDDSTVPRGPHTGTVDRLSGIVSGDTPFVSVRHPAA